MDLYDVVELTVDLPAEDLPAGTIGTVVHIFDQPNRAFEVEFAESQEVEALPANPEVTRAVRLLMNARARREAVSYMDRGDYAASVGKILGNVDIDTDRSSEFSVLGNDAGSVLSVTLANEVVSPTRPLAITRNVAAPSRSTVIVPFDDATGLHRIDDPDVGDTLFVVTAAAPTRGFLKAQEFVEFAPETIQIELQSRDRRPRDTEPIGRHPHADRHVEQQMRGVLLVKVLLVHVF